RLSVEGNCVELCSFFFQAEDGIRDFHVTGVQTCALPIYCYTCPDLDSDNKDVPGYRPFHSCQQYVPLEQKFQRFRGQYARVCRRSEERRVGKECRSRGAA